MGIVSIIATGGTIASLARAEDGDVVASRSGEDLISDVESPASIEVVDFANMGSYAFTFQTLYDLALEVNKKIADPSVSGIVITHGTDTMEETAFFLSMVCTPAKPIVLTGAQLTAKDHGSDGTRNLTEAIRIANTAEAAKWGPVIVFSGFIYCAREVVKADTHALEGFASPGWGPVGRVDGEDVIVARSLRAYKQLPLKELRPVLSIRLSLGMTGEEIIRMAEPYEGIVLEAYGRGNAHPSVAGAIKALIADNKPVVLASRCYKGAVKGVYGDGGARDLERAGVWMSGDLDALKARLLLSLILANDLRGEEGKRYIEDRAKP